MSILDVKLRNVGGYLRAVFAPNSIASSFQAWSKTYIVQHFGKNATSKPIYHIMVGVGLLGYFLEYPHIKKEAIAKYH